MSKSFFQRSRELIDEELAHSELRWKFSPSLLVLRRELIPLLQETLQGDVLDVGCGRMPFRSYLDPARVTSYDGFDLERRSPATRYLGDAQSMTEIEDDTYDAVVSFFALEHMPKPWEALREMARVCKPGGTIVVALPHVSRLHEEPHDYFRFTHYGLRAMGRDIGLELHSDHRMGGVFTFLAHQVSCLAVCAFWPIPMVKWLVFWLNYGLIVRPAAFLDPALKTHLKFPVNVAAVYRKPIDEADSE